MNQDILVCQKGRKLSKTSGLMSKRHTGQCEGRYWPKIEQLEHQKWWLINLNTGNMKIHKLSVILKVGGVKRKTKQKKAHRCRQNKTLQVSRTSSPVSEHWQLKKKNRACIHFLCTKVVAFVDEGKLFTKRVENLAELEGRHFTAYNEWCDSSPGHPWRKPLGQSVMGTLWGKD